MNEIEQALKKAMPRIAIRLNNELAIAAPWDTGRLSASIKVEVGDGVLIITMVEYGKYVEFGTPPHIIKPKDKKALHWGGKDGPIVKLVKHPGQRPNPFIRNTIRNKIGEIIQQEILKAIS